ncbi:uncharacterized protein LOC106088562 isoform X2 [Stomoxys calcitrans]|uniref:uncharacterized protein LOC106088562 isoform X2 n=1 Tax=Stomoxys calcitrans TaxID=35570 RepID=UPI0027E39536|nr:uncharacterized protein LOC106088562 isoform X2 [Stomoxys calcitrans]
MKELTHEEMVFSTQQLLVCSGILMTNLWHLREKFIDPVCGVNYKSLKGLLTLFQIPVYLIGWRKNLGSSEKIASVAINTIFNQMKLYAKRRIS